MAAPTNIVSLSLGNQTVGLAEFKTGSNGGLVLSSYQTRELLADPAADATRLAQTKLALGELAQHARLKSTRVSYAISAQSVFTRFVKLPSVGEEQVEQIVTFEAQQNVPYPIDEVVWDYALVDSGQASEVEVVIVAIKSDLLDDINAAVEEAHLKTAIVDVAPMALYNAFRYNYSDVDGCSLIIDIGARSTNLIFIEPNKVFSRSIPNAGSTITQAIARDFNEPFGAAEERKKRDGFVSLGGAYAEPEDPEVARVSKMIRNSMTRLHAEIARSISFYRSQQGGSAPQRVFLSGGSVTLPYMREFFHEKFQLPVEFFNPLRNVAVGNGLNVEEIGRSAHRMGELVGLALRGTSNCPMELNLRPRSVVRKHQLAKQRPFIVLAGVCTLLAVAGWWLYFDRAATVTQEVVDKLGPKVTGLQSLENKMKAARSDISAQQATAAPLLVAVEERGYWVKIIEDINARLPKELVWITSFEAKVQAAPADGAEPHPTPGPGPKGQPVVRPTVVTLKGLYLFNPKGASVVDGFVDKLTESDLYTVDKEPPRFKRNVPNDSDWAYEFEIPLILKNPITLPTINPR
ncbi:MAG: type IV pilus assembly protein PilM [Chthoniobacter sp.]|nr:type IV pilus assembly protein PilM [Chthoniobacter sp.]